MDTLREFFVSESGLVPVRRGLGLGWLISILSVIAVLLGGKEALADECKYRKVKKCAYNADCEEENENEPIRCCYYQQYRDCSRDRLYCECVA